MNISEFQKCTNCGACSNLCPHGAITIAEDGQFYKPVVDESKCTHCGLCSNRCPVNGSSVSFAPIYACAGWHNTEQVVLDSSSGGVFHGLADYVSAQGGIVFGAAWTCIGTSNMNTTANTINIFAINLYVFCNLPPYISSPSLFLFAYCCFCSAFNASYFSFHSAAFAASLSTPYPSS